MSKAMLGIALIELNRRAIAHDEVADFLRLLQAPAARPLFSIPLDHWYEIRTIRPRRHERLIRPDR